MPVRALGGSEAEHRRLGLFVWQATLFLRPPNIIGSPQICGVEFERVILQFSNLRSENLGKIKPQISLVGNAM